MNEKDKKQEQDEMKEEHSIPDADIPKGKKSGTVKGDPIIEFGI